MDLADTVRLLDILSTADGGCISCYRKLLYRAVIAFPDAPWEVAFTTWSVDGHPRQETYYPDDFRALREEVVDARAETARKHAASAR